MSNWRVHIVSLLTACLLASAGLLAIARQTLPAVMLTTAEGAGLESARLAQPGRWLMVIIGPDCRTCDRVLATVRSDRDPMLAQRMTIVVGGGSAASVVALSRRFPDLAQAGWFADPDRRMTGALRVAGVPIVLGISGGTIEWSLTGIPRTAEDVRSAMRSWIAEK